MGYHYYRVSELSVYRIWQAAENKVVITIHVLGKSNPSRFGSLRSWQFSRIADRQRSTHRRQLHRGHPSSHHPRLAVHLYVLHGVYQQRNVSGRAHHIQSEADLIVMSICV